MIGSRELTLLIDQAVEMDVKPVKRGELERLPKGERENLCVFWNGRNAWLVKKDFIDSEQSPLVVFAGEESAGILNLEAWPNPTFEYWKRLLDAREVAR